MTASALGSQSSSSAFRRADLEVCDPRKTFGTAPFGGVGQIIVLAINNVAVGGSSFAWIVEKASTVPASYGGYSNCQIVVARSSRDIIYGNCYS